MLSPHINMAGDENSGVNNKCKSPLPNTPRLNVLQPSNKHNIISKVSNEKSKGSPKKCDPYSLIRQLDDEEQWVERTSIITKQDHDNNLIYATQFLQEILEALPVNKDDSGILNQSEKVFDKTTDNCIETVCQDDVKDELPETKINDSGMNSPMSSLCNNMFSMNFEEVDENVNPFQTRSQVQNSPCQAPSRGEGDSVISEPLKSSDADNFFTENVDESKIDENLVNDVAIKPEDSNTDLEIDLNQIPSKDASDDDVIVPSKGYNIDFDQLDEMSNPFQITKQLANSPCVKNSPAGKSNNAVHDLGEDNRNPFATKNQLANSPVLNAKSANYEHQNNSALESSDRPVSKPETPKSHTTTQVLSPGLKMHIESDTGTAGFTIDLDEIDNSKPPTQVQNSPALAVGKGTYDLNLDQIDETFNPFEPKKQMCNSPVAPTKSVEQNNDGESDEAKVKMLTTPKLEDKFTLDVEDPFQTKTIVSNSPIATSDSLGQNEDKTQTKGDVSLELLNLPALESISQESFESIENPFATKSTVANSPLRSPKKVHFEDEEDPFKSKTQLPNSPTMQIEEDPFKTKKQLANSPVSRKEGSPVKEDPFKTKKQLANSPVSRKEVSPVKEDPFKTKKQLANSPVSKRERSPVKEDPFKTKSQVKNSPMKSGSPQKSPSKKSPKSSQSVEKPKWQNAKSISKVEPTSPPRRAVSDTGKSSFSPSKSPKKSPSKSPRSSPNDSPSRSSQSPKQQENATPPPIRGRKKLHTETTPSTTVDQPFPEETEPSPHPFECHLDQTVVVNRGPGVNCELLQQQQQEALGEEFDNQLFVPASEVFSSMGFDDPSVWDLLEKAGSGEDKESALARMSLYVKFDPLVKPPKQLAKTSPESQRLSYGGGLLGNRPCMQSISEGDENLLGTPPAAKIMSRLTQRVEIQKKSPKPDLMADVDQILSCDSPLDDKLSSDCPNMAMTTENSGELVQMLQYSDADIKRMRTQLELSYQSEILIKEKDWHNKLLEVKEDGEAKLKEATEQIEDFKKREAEREAAFCEMKLIMADYEKTISEVLAEKEKGSQVSQKSMEEAILAKEKALEEVASVEKMFSHLHSRYEQLKGVLTKQKQNEETLKKGFADQRTKLENVTASYKALKQQAEEKLSKASEELEKAQKCSKAESARLNALLKKRDLQIEGLESSLKQKTKENQELTQICDELISKVGM